MRLTVIFPTLLLFFAATGAVIGESRSSKAAPEAVLTKAAIVTLGIEGSGSDMGEASAKCPSGRAPLSGGFLVLAGKVNISFSHARPPSSWVVGADNDSSQAQARVQVHAYCVKSIKYPRPRQ